jgi:hypothetical protein
LTACARSVGRLPALQPNHAIDLNLLHHLADGLLIASRDYRFIEDVDASGTSQAPWVRTVGELIAGKFPSGPPFAASARLAWKKHRPRTRLRLGELDKEGEAMAKNEEG